MSIVSLGLNLLLAGLLAAALAMGWRLNRRLQGLRDAHAGFATAVRELNIATQRAEQGLAELRAATEATDLLADRIEKGRALAARLERLVGQAPPQAERLSEETEDRAQERRLGALLAAAREARARPERLLRREPGPGRARTAFDEELFADPPSGSEAVRGDRR